ncbi:MAG TPA: porin [Fluviicoccus sp.]|nr:porin [Fluviicoccus sp.]
MKRNLLALAVGAAVLLPLTAQAAPTVYGRLNLSVDYVDTDAAGFEPQWNVNSNASRVGVKGNEKLSDDFTAVYKAEWTVNGDLAGGGDLSGRERYVGLKHSSLGTIRLGAIDSPLKTSEDMVDAFNDNVNLDMGANGVTGQNRLDNSINYVSPKILDVFGANITFVPGESQAENHLGDGISAAFSYEDDNLYLSAAIDSDIAALDSTRLVGRYKMDKLVLAALIQKSEVHGVADTDENSFVISGSYEMDKLTFRGEILSSTHDLGNATDEAKVTLVGVGVDYNFTQSTKVYGNLASGKTETDIGGVSADVSGMILGGGIEVRF